MTNRLLDFAESAAHLGTENGLLIIQQPGKERQTVPLGDIAALVTSHPQIVMTQNLLAALGQAGAVVICCDQRHHPASMLLPLDAHFAQTGRFQAQAAAPLPLKKRVWQQLVRAKVRAQAGTLARLGLESAGLEPLAARVRSGDPDNVEATAAVRYWPRLFADTGFRRGRKEDPRNAILNYGYAILRGLTARAVCAAGLHPSLGVNHHNRYNAFCLADDLMEPLRPLVDYSAAALCRDGSREQWELNKTAKLILLATMAARYRVAGERRTLFDFLAGQAQRLAAIFEGKTKGFVCEPVEVDD